MKKITIITLICMSLIAQAQYIDSENTTAFESQVQNTQSIAGLFKLFKIARSNKNNKQIQMILEKMVLLKPENAGYKYQLAEFYAQIEEKTKAFNTLISLQKQGLYYDIENNKKLTNINSYPVFKYIKNNMDANGTKFGEGEESFNIDKSFSGLLFESLDFHDEELYFLMGSMRDGSVIKVSNTGETTVLIPASNGGVDGPWSTVDLAIDKDNNVLWVASSAITQFGKNDEKSTGSAGVFKYQLDTGKLIKSYLLPANKKPSLISSIHLTEQGDVYFTEYVQNLILKIGSKSDDIVVVFASDVFKSISNVTSDETGKFLYVSDSEDGIIIVDLENQISGRIVHGPGLTLMGISEMIYEDNSLIIMQSAFKPERVMRLKLKENKTEIEAVIPIESSNPIFNSVSKGVILGPDLYYIANSQTVKTDKYGGLLPGQQWENMVILKTSKHYNEEQSLEYKKKIDTYKKKMGAN